RIPPQRATPRVSVRPALLPRRKYCAPPRHALHRYLALVLLAAAASRRQQIKLGGIRAARRRLDVLHAREIALQSSEQARFGAALQHLGEKRAAGREHFAREVG